MKDPKGHIRTVRKWTGSSVFDFNHDGLTNATDKQTILTNIPLSCRYIQTRCGRVGSRVEANSERLRGATLCSWR